MIDCFSNNGIISKGGTMSKQFFIYFLLFAAFVILFGCAKNKLPSIDDLKYAISQPVDANKDGIIDEKDVVILETNAKECFYNFVLPFYEESGIKLKIEKDSSLDDILKASEESNTKENIQKLQENLSYVKYKELRNGKDKLYKIAKQWETTKTAMKANDSGTVTGLLYYPDRLICKLKDNRAIMLIGIGVPTHASKYRKMCDEKFYSLTLNKVVKIEYDVLKSGDNFLFGYLYVDDVFVNAKMVSEGYAWVKSDPPNNRYDSIFAELEETAKKKKDGIWKYRDINKIDDNDFGIVVGLSPDYPDRLICELKDGRLVKLIGIGVPTYTSEYRKMSDDKLSALVLNKTVKIEYDNLKYEGDFLLGYMHFGNTFINSEMVSTGYARAKPMSPNNRYDAEFIELEEEAKKKKRGIWALTDEFK